MPKGDSTMITFYFQELPFTDVRGCVHKTHSGNYNVLINTNAQFSKGQIAEAIRHEMNHIRRNHFESEKPLSDVETEADTF